MPKGLKSGVVWSTRQYRESDRDSRDNIDNIDIDRDNIESLIKSFGATHGTLITERVEAKVIKRTNMGLDPIASALNTSYNKSREYG